MPSIVYIATSTGFILVNSSSMNTVGQQNEPKFCTNVKKKVFRVHKFHVQFRISTETSSNVPYNIKST